MKHSRKWYTYTETFLHINVIEFNISSRDLYFIYSYLPPFFLKEISFAQPEILKSYAKEKDEKLRKVQEHSFFYYSIFAFKLCATIDKL